MRAISEWEATLIQSRLAAAAATIRQLATRHPDAADDLALIQSDLVSIRAVLNWRGEGKAA